MQRTILGKVLLGAAFVLCPCHLPIYFALLGGTAVGALFSENTGMTAAALTIAFVTALVLGLRLSRKSLAQVKPSVLENRPDE
ncbi:MAG: mercury resistance protein [Nitrospinota bacterium]